MVFDISRKINSCKVRKTVESSQRAQILLLQEKGFYLLHLPLLLLNNLVQQSLEAVLREESDKQDLFKSTCRASLNCYRFTCVSAWAARVTISSLTERPLGMPVRDSWPFHCGCDNNDWRWGFDGPKTPGNESFKWQHKKGHVCSCSTHCKVSTRVPVRTMNFHVTAMLI